MGCGAYVAVSSLAPTEHATPSRIEREQERRCSITEYHARLDGWAEATLERDATVRRNSLSGAASGGGERRNSITELLEEHTKRRNSVTAPAAVAAAGSSDTPTPDKKPQRRRVLAATESGHHMRTISVGWEMGVKS